MNASFIHTATSNCKDLPCLDPLGLGIYSGLLTLLSGNGRRRDRRRRRPGNATTSRIDPSWPAAVVRSHLNAIRRAAVRQT